MTEAKVAVGTIKIVPRKVRLVLDLIRGKNTVETTVILRLTNKASLPVTEKALMSALANAEHNYDMNTDKLVVREAYANRGPMLKRFHPRAQGRASAINKRTSCTTIVVSDGKEEAKEA